jgi:acyl-CoA dehydrogenase
MIDFEIPLDLEEIRQKVKEFVRDVAIPAESRDQGGHGLADDLRAELQAAAREAGIFAPGVGTDLGGLGLDMRGQAVVLEEAGYSILGPQALNCAAPDEGNMHLLAKVATAAQRERYLAPLARGEVRSCFAMSEPAPGAGSDPSMLQTRAERVPGGWSISGRKWFATGAEGAAFAICMARTDVGATMFLVPTDRPGWRVERLLDVNDRGFPGGHAELAIEDCRIDDDAVLGAVGEGFDYAQVRLAPARLTHCMRWIGAARRALDVAIERAIEREAFGLRLLDQGMVQERIARSVIDLESARALTWRGAWAVDSGLPARRESSIAKAHVAEVVVEVVDRAVQICGALGLTADTPLRRLADEIRPFRIYDGPTETHYSSIARRAARELAADRT